jgi:hypothetical protein
MAFGSGFECFDVQKNFRDRGLLYPVFSPGQFHQKIQFLRRFKSFEQIFFASSARG